MKKAEEPAQAKEDIEEKSSQAKPQDSLTNTATIGVANEIGDKTNNEQSTSGQSIGKLDAPCNNIVQSPDPSPLCPLGVDIVMADSDNAKVKGGTPKSNSVEPSPCTEQNLAVIQSAIKTENIVDNKVIFQAIEPEEMTNKLFKEDDSMKNLVIDEAEKNTELVPTSLGQDFTMVDADVKGNVLPETTQTTVPPVISSSTFPNLGPNPIKKELGISDNDEVLGNTSASLKTTGLSLLASQYVSDSDSDDVYEVPPLQTYQNRFVEIDSDSSSSDVEVMGEARSPIDLEILGAGHGEEDDEENQRTSRTPMVKGELHLDDLPPIQNLHITVPEEECIELGKVQSIIEQLVLVNSLPGTVPLDLETVLFLEKGKQVLGEIFDVLGQVSDPLYCVRFNSNKEIKQKGIVVGQTVYVAPRTQHTQFIVLANLMKVRGSDASWENDIEPPERFLDYSDDEEERTARRSIRNRNRSLDADDEAPKRQRPGEPHFPNSGGLPPPRPYRGNYYSPGSRQPHYPPTNNYNIAGNSWHSNYYPNYPPPHLQHQQYRMPIHPSSPYRPPPRNMSHGPPPLHPGPPPTHPGLVLNPYAVFPPPHLMQQPLFPPPQQPPPPPPPAGFQ